MKVFVAGATGVIGRRAVEQLVAAGHEVTGLARSDEKARLLEGLGATPVRVSLFDPVALREAVVGHEAVVNLATKIPPVAQSALPWAWKENDRIRTEGSCNLVDAALAAGATRFVQESITFGYADRSEEWIDEESPMDVLPALESSRAAEEQTARFTAAGGTGVVLRFAMFYGAGADHTDTFFALARRGLSPFPGRSGAYASLIHLDDAAAAAVAALDAPAGLYNVVDDEPLPRSEHDNVLAEAVGRRRLRRTPPVLLRMGNKNAESLMRSQRVSNRRFREVTGWRPRYPSVRQGWPQVVEEYGGRAEVAATRVSWQRFALFFLALLALELGVWASISPSGFFDTFPGLGRQWTAVDGPYNEHLVRDFGALNLALAVVTVAALVVRTKPAVRTAAGAWLAFQVPHFLYHVRNLDVYGTADAVASQSALALTIVVSAALLWRPQAVRRASTPARA